MTTNVVVHEPHPGECPFCGEVHGSTDAELERCQALLEAWRPTGMLGGLQESLAVIRERYSDALNELGKS